MNEDTFLLLISSAAVRIQSFAFYFSLSCHSFIHSFIHSSFPAYQLFHLTEYYTRGIGSGADGIGIGARLNLKMIVLADQQTLHLSLVYDFLSFLFLLLFFKILLDFSLPCKRLSRSLTRQHTTDHR